MAREFSISPSHLEQKLKVIAGLVAYILCLIFAFSAGYYRGAREYAEAVAGRNFFRHSKGFLTPTAGSHSLVRPRGGWTQGAVRLLNL